MKWLVSKPQKLIEFLQSQLGAAYSGKQIRRMLDGNLCRVNGGVERFASRLLQKGDRVEFEPAVQSSRSPQFQTLYEDEFFKIVDKPPNWVCDDKEALRTFGASHFLVHRLDKDTTGLLIVAKSSLARDRLMELFEERKIEKQYLAVVDGVPKEEGGTRKSFLAKKKAYQGQTIWGSSPKGLTAVTQWKTLAKGKSGSLLLCEPHTGRTHQIRVHLSEMGHPLLIDRQYARSFRCRLFIQRPLLHAYRLRFEHPFLPDKWIDLAAPLPVDIGEALLNLGIVVAHLRELAGEGKQDDRGDQHHSDKNAEEIRETVHLVH